MINLSYKKKLFVFIFFVIILIIAIKILFNRKEHFFTPWSIGTRFFPSYDIRGYPGNYPQIFPWNYPWPGIPWLYWSPYFYEVDGKYRYDAKYAKKLKKEQRKYIKERN